MLDEFIAYLEQEVENGSIYVLGAQGQRGAAAFTDAFLNTREHGNITNINRDKALLKKRIDAGYNAQKIGAFDCSGLGMYFLQNLKRLYSSDMTANGMRSKCEQITREELKRGDWVFITNNGTASHIGFVVDDALNVIEARGRDYGVVKIPMRVEFNYFGRPLIFKDEIEAPKEITRELKKGDKGEDVKAYQEALVKCGYTLPKYGADGSYGTETQEATKALQRDSINGIAKQREVEAVGLVWKQQPETDYKAKYEELLTEYNELKACVAEILAIVSKC